MRKFFTLLLAFTAIFSTAVFAQCNPEFNFTVNGNNATVQFSPVNNSALAQHSWFFGDGASSNETAPMHYYFAGAYNVVHVVTAYSPNDSNVVECIDSSVRLVTVAAPPACNLNASFSFTRDPVQTNKVYFTNLSTGTNANTIMEWSFGDGGGSYDTNPVYVFPTSGAFIVCLRARRDNLCASDTCAIVQVQLQPCNVAVNFSSSPSTSAPNVIQFTNLTNPLPTVDSLTWYFGDGTTSIETNPLHTYSQGGTFTVCLVAKKFANGTIACVSEFCSDIVIQPFCDIVPDFFPSRNSFQYVFVNTTVNLSAADSSFWDFGDGPSAVFVPGYNATHSYAAPGTYTVCLTVKKAQPGSVNVLCERQVCHTVSVDSPQVACNLVAYFSQTADSTFYNQIYFSNLITGLSSTDSIRWNFGDGGISTNANPVHSYNEPGIYTVCLRVKKAQVPGAAPCVSEYCQTILVQPQPQACNVNAAFTFRSDSVQTNKVYFINYSTGTTPNTVIRWGFGDGTSSFDMNPVHIYQTPGTYTVCLTVRRDSLCASDTCIVVQVQAPNQCNLVANFGFTIDSINTSRIHFANLSTPLAATDSVIWHFGDGSVSHDVFNVSHTYAQGGVFQVCLVVKKPNSAGTTSCLREICQRVIVDTPQVTCNLVASFTFRRDSLPTTPTSPYIFENTSTPLTNADSSFWDFGDGSPVAINPNNPVVHAYTSPGTYIVCLRVKKVLPGSTNIICERQTCQTIEVANTSNPCNELQANFTWITDSSNNREIYFINQSSPLTANTLAYWSFGDGDSSMASSPTHIYAQPGTYTVCLTMRLGNVCVKDTCQTIVVQGASNPCNQLQVNFTWAADSSNGGKIYFNNQSSPLTTNTYTQWLFGDGTSGTALSPDHIYIQPGTYTVCLRMGILGTNCVKDTCQTVVVLPGTIDSCNIQPNFIYYIDSANRRKVDFINNTVVSPSSANAVWSFGDGASGTGWNAGHEYQLPGWHLVCLTVTNGNTCTRTHCDSIFVPGNVIPPVNCDSFQLQFGYRTDNYMANKLYFTATGNAPVYNQQWSFAKAGDSVSILINQNNPVFVFPDTGLYRVCVKAAFSSNCVKEYCDEVSITNTSVPSQCMLSAFPNPAHNYVTYNVQLTQAGVVTSIIYNMQGTAVMQYTQTGVSGNNPVTLNVQNLAPGFYTVRILYSGRVCYTRFQKM